VWSSFGAVTAVAVLVVLLGYARSLAAQMPTHPHPTFPDANRLPDANEQMEMREKNTKKQQFEAANTERLRQMNKESNGLLTVAIALKAEVDNTNKSGNLSPNAIRKVDAIEKLARNMKEKMKLTVGPH
jgi:hypothetical protein